jgi:hypothetical protein
VVTQRIVGSLRWSRRDASVGALFVVLRPSRFTLRLPPRTSCCHMGTPCCACRRHRVRDGVRHALVPLPSQGQEESWLFLGMRKTTPQDGRRGPIVEWLHGPTGQPLGKMVEDPGTGKITGFDAHGRSRGTYDPTTNTTRGAGGRPAGTGNLLPALVMNCVCPSGVGGTRRSVVVKK